MPLLVTGSAGFIGFHLSKHLLDAGEDVIGIDNLNDYYDVNLKNARLEILRGYKNFEFRRLDISNRKLVGELFENVRFDRVFHLAAQAGVRYSIENPSAYIDANLVGFGNILEGCRRQWLGDDARDVGSKLTVPNHLIYASSSSVYGINTKLPFSTRDDVDHPISLYAATKKSNELMAHVYSHLYGIPTTGLRFFTVYGPWGRPDMALFKFVKAILKDETIDVYNDGKMRRDFTFIDDVIEGLMRVASHIPVPVLGDDMTPNVSPTAPYKVYNIGNNNPVELMDFIHAIENTLDRKAKLNFLPMQAGDVPATYADVDDLIMDVDYSPSTKVSVGIERFVDWYRQFYDE